MKKTYAIGISLVAGVVALWIVFTQFSITDIIDAFRGAPIYAAIGYILVSICIMLVLAWRWQNIMKAQKIHVPFKHIFAYKIAGYGVSYLTPGAKIGGEAIRASLLKKHGISFQKGLSGIVIDKLMELTTSGFFFIIGAIVAFATYELPTSIKLMSIFITAWISIFMGYFYYKVLMGKPCFKEIFRLLRIHKTKKGKIFEKKLIKFETTIIKFYHKDKKEFLITTAISLLAWLLMFAEYKFILLMLGIQGTTFSELFLIITFIGASYLLPIPMALGVLEAGQLSIFRMINLKETAGIALALITRTKDLVWTIIGFIILSFYGFNVSKSVQEASTLTEDIKKLEKK